MAKITGISFLVKINTSTTGTPTYTSVGGQRSATLSLSTNEIDASDKLSDGWAENLAGLRKWSISGNGCGDDADAACAALEAAWLANKQLEVQLETPSGKKYDGLATITDLSYDAPHDDMFTYSITMSGTGALTITPAAGG